LLAVTAAVAFPTRDIASLLWSGGVGDGDSWAEQPDGVEADLGTTIGELRQQG